MLFIHPLVLQSSCSLRALLLCILNTGVFGCNTPCAPLGSSPRSEQVVTELDNMGAYVPQDDMSGFAALEFFFFFLRGVGGVSLRPGLPNGQRRRWEVFV